MGRWSEWREGLDSDGSLKWAQRRCALWLKPVRLIFVGVDPLSSYLNGCSTERATWCSSLCRPPGWERLLCFVPNRDGIERKQEVRYTHDVDVWVAACKHWNSCLMLVFQKSVLIEQLISRVFPVLWIRLFPCFGVAGVIWVRRRLPGGLSLPIEHQSGLISHVSGKFSEWQIDWCMGGYQKRFYFIKLFVLQSEIVFFKKKKTLSKCHRPGV